MDYVEWVERVIAALVQAWRAADAHTKLIGVGLPEILRALGFDEDPRAPDFQGSKLAEALRDAVRDLDRMGLVGDESHRNFKLTHEGSKYPSATLSTAWPQIMGYHIDNDQEVFLSKIAEIGQEIYEGYVCLSDLTGEQIFGALDWAWDSEGVSKCYLLGSQLSEIGMVQQRPYVGGRIDIIPTYFGLVRVTRQAETEFGRLVHELLADWETTNVDFKRELNLGRNIEKAEFVRDVLGIATTKSSGRRFLVIGFDDTTRNFVQSVDPGITQERLEQILHAYCEPVPKIRYKVIPHRGGDVGLIETFRDPQGLPYRVKKRLGGSKGIQTGDIYVRHGSHTEPPTERELEDLEAEVRSARREI